MESQIFIIFSKNDQTRKIFSEKSLLDFVQMYLNDILKENTLRQKIDSDENENEF